MTNLASLIQAPPPVPPTPRPTHGQAVAGYHRLQETKRLMGKILQDPKTGHSNIRPLVLDAGAKLISDRLQSLAEFMSGISNFPPAEDPLGQKKWVQQLFAASSMAQRSLLQHHRAANAPDGTLGASWAADDHSNHMSALMAHYPR
jgi:hypothetical protein